MGLKKRDSQRSKVYGAERTVSWRQNRTGDFEDAAEVSAFVREILAHHEVRRAFGPRVCLPNVDIRKPHPRKSNSSANEFAIWLHPRNGFNRGTVVHELGHVIQRRVEQHAPDGIPSKWSAGHGPEFCGVYLFLAEVVLGLDAARELEKAFEAAGVRCHPLDLALESLRAGAPAPRRKAA